MHNQKINPPALYNSVAYGFSHASLQTGGRTLHCAGQTAWDADYNLIGPGDLAAQARQALANLRAVLAEAGATPADIIRLRTYVVNHSPEKLAIVGPEMAAFYGDATPAPNTWLGVQALALPEFLIEIEATAAVD